MGIFICKVRSSASDQPFAFNKEEALSNLKKKK
jgi:hypothetical protein